MQKKVHPQLGKRARQVLELLYSRGRLTAAELHEALPDLPSYSAARAVLRRLESLGVATHETDGSRYVYKPVIPRSEAKTSALRHLIDTFFAGSAAEAMQALVDLSGPGLSEAETRQLYRLIERAEGEKAAGEKAPRRNSK